MRWARVALAVTLALIAGTLGVTSPSSASPHTEITGTLGVWHAENFDPAREVSEDLRLDTGTSLVKLLLDDRRALGKRVHLRGSFVHEHGEQVFVPTEATTVPDSVAGGVPPGVRKVAVVMLNFTNDRTQPWSAADVHSVMSDNADSVNAFYREASNGQVTFTSDVFGWYPINIANSGCNIDAWRTAANLAATAAGANLATYQHVVYIWPRTTSCSWGGLSDAPGSTVFINGPLMSGTISHELAHNFGIAHAQGLSCTSGATKVTLSDTCTADEYGDPFSTMGGGYNQMHNNWHLAALGWLNSAQTVTANGTYSLAPVGNTSGSPRLVRIARPDGNYLNLEFRQPGPFENYQPDYPVVHGVLIRLAPDPSVIGSPPKLLDTTPATPTWWDSALAVGQTFSDQYGTSASHVQITTLSVSPSGATVSIQFPGVPPTTTTTSTTTTTTSTTTTSTTTSTTTTTTAPPTTTTAPPTTTTAPPTTTTTTTTTLPGGTGQPAYVKTVATATKSQSGNTTLTLTAPTSSSTTAGNQLVLSAAIGTGAGAVTCSDNRGNPYAIDARAATNNLFVCSAHLTTALQAGDTIKITYPGFSGVSAASASEFSGIAATSPVDGTSRGSSTSTKTVSVNPALITSNAKDLLLGFVGGTGAFTATNGFTGIGSFGGMSTAFESVSAKGTFATFGSVTTGAWRALLIAYRVA